MGRGTRSRVRRARFGRSSRRTRFRRALRRRRWIRSEFVLARGDPPQVAGYMGGGSAGDRVLRDSGQILRSLKLPQDDDSGEFYEGLLRTDGSPLDALY